MKTLPTPAVVNRLRDQLAAWTSDNRPGAWFTDPADPSTDEGIHAEEELQRIYVSWLPVGVAGLREIGVLRRLVAGGFQPNGYISPELAGNHHHSPKIVLLAEIDRMIAELRAA